MAKLHGSPCLNQKRSEPRKLRESRSLRAGIKLFGQGEWNAEKHGRERRSWRKLHLAVDADTGEIVASTLTDSGDDDAGQVPVLLEQIEGEIASVTVDGAYDGNPVYHAVACREPHPPPLVVIPPR